jgi:hypothetical protein
VNILHLEIVAPSTTESLPCRKSSGTSLQRSERVAVHQEMPCVSVSPETVKVITAMCLSLMDQTLSSDCMWMAMRSAEDMAIGAGVPQATAHEIVRQVGQAWLLRRSRNPLSGMFA